jgi:hypothetical protein
MRQIARIHAGLILAALSAALSAPALAAEGGGSNGGGGDIVRFPDGKVTIADPFLNPQGPQPNGLPPLRMLHPRLVYTVGQAVRALKTLDSGDSCPKNSSSCEVFATLEKFVKEPASVRVFVTQTTEEMNMYCASGGPKSYTLPDGATVERAACTSGDDMFLVTPLFAQLGLGDQALLILHERLTTLRDQLGGRNYGAVSATVAGLKAALGIAKEQATGGARALSEQQVKALAEMYVGLAELQDLDAAYAGDNATAFGWTITPNGGAKIKDKIRLESGVFAGVTSRIDHAPTACDNGCVIEARTEITDSKITFYSPKLERIAAGQKIRNVEINARAQYHHFAADTYGKPSLVSWTWKPHQAAIRTKKLFDGDSFKDHYPLDPESRYGYGYNSFNLGSVQIHCGTYGTGLFNGKRWLSSCEVRLQGQSPSDPSLRGLDSKGKVRHLGYTRYYLMRYELERKLLETLPLPKPLSKTLVDGQELYVIRY